MPTPRALPNQPIDQPLADVVVAEADVAHTFRSYQVELLLNSAASLLDRCSAERRQAQELAAMVAREELSDATEQLLVSRQSRRVDSGWYKHGYDKAAREEVLLYELQTLYEEAERNYNTYYYSLRGDAQKAVAPHLSLNSVSTKRWGNERSINAVDRSQLLHPNNEANETKLDTDGRVAILHRKAEYLDSGPLNYQDQILILVERMTRDYEEASKRLAAASKGLRTIYNFTEDSFSDSVSRRADLNIGALDNAVRWTRNAIQWLSEFAALDQSFTLTFSVREYLADEEWKNLLECRKVTFRLPRKLFADHAYVRTRGISAGVVFPSMASAAVKVTLTLPVDAWYEWNNGGGVRLRTGAGETSQRDVPACVLGRVLDVSNPQPQEIAGSVSLLNASPIGLDGGGGEWDIVLSPIRPQSLIGMEDLLIDLRLSGRPHINPQADRRTLSSKD